MINANLTFAFTAGMVATVNPCGFAMLPAYLSFFLGLESGSPDADRPRASLGRALLTGLVVSAGFLLVFGIVGVAVTAGLQAIRDIVPWIAIVIGAVLIVLGIAVLSGFRLQAVLPKIERGGDSRNLRSLFLFGVSYAVASVSCGLPTFTVVVSTSVNDFQSSLASFVAYAFGMAVVLMALTISLATARTSLLTGLRKALPYVDRVAGLLMVLAGLYMVWFWVTERLGSEQGGIVLRVEQWSGSLANFINGIGGMRLGVGLSVIVALAALVVLIRPDDKEQAGGPTISGLG
ncbi:MAG: cytochrome c-type biogenesis protein [Candidatus Poriferisodalaceae bacterium]|jgi:cytochrome c-type biogenesis protein